MTASKKTEAARLYILAQAALSYEDLRNKVRHHLSPTHASSEGRAFTKALNEWKHGKDLTWFSDLVTGDRFTTLDGKSGIRTSDLGNVAGFINAQFDGESKPSTNILPFALVEKLEAPTIQSDR